MLLLRHRGGLLKQSRNQYGRIAYVRSCHICNRYGHRRGSRAFRVIVVAIHLVPDIIGSRVGFCRDGCDIKGFIRRCLVLGGHGAIKCAVCCCILPAVMVTSYEAADLLWFLYPPCGRRSKHAEVVWVTSTALSASPRMHTLCPSSSCRRVGWARKGSRKVG